MGITGTNKSADDLQKLVDAAMDHWGRIDVLVNSAGHGPRAPILELSDEDWHEGMEVYFLNAVRPSRLVTPIMEKQGGGPSSTSRPLRPLSQTQSFRRRAMRAGLASFTKLFAITTQPQISA